MYMEYKQSILLRIKALIFISCLFGLVSASATNRDIPVRDIVIQEKVKVINAVYFSYGGMKNILIKVEKSFYGMRVTSTCVGKDYYGRQVWQNLSPVKVTKNDVDDTNIYSAGNDYISACRYSADLGEITVYF